MVLETFLPVTENTTINEGFCIQTFFSLLQIMMIIYYFEVLPQCFFLLRGFCVGN